MPEPRRVTAAKGGWAAYYPGRNWLSARVYDTRRELIAAYDARCYLMTWAQARRCGMIRAVRVSCIVTASIEG